MKEQRSSSSSLQNSVVSDSVEPEGETLRMLMDPFIHKGCIEGDSFYNMYITNAIIVRPVGGNVIVFQCPLDRVVIL